MITAEEQRATLLALYPLFKEEVYRRREEIMRWTAAGIGSLCTILLVLLLVPEPGRLTLTGRALAAGGILLLTATFIVLILQQQHRHRQAKRTLIELERALGLFDAATFPNRHPLYPEHWQTDWTRDRSVVFSILMLGSAALLALLAAVFGA
jgi:hypothetical protein